MTGRRGLLIAAVVLLGACLPPDVKPPLLRDARFNAAERLFLEGRYRAAASEIDRFLAQRSDARAYLLRGRCRLMEGSFDDARKDFEAARGAARSLEVYIQAMLGLGDAAYSDHDYAAAVDIYGLLLDNYRRRVPTAVTMLRHAHALLRHGRLEQGRQLLRQVQIEFPGSAAAREAAELAGEARGSFYVQVGLYASRDNAARTEERLLEDGFDAAVVEQRGQYAVIIGYFEDVEIAKTVLAQVTAAGYRDAFLKP